MNKGIVTVRQEQTVADVAVAASGSLAAASWIADLGVVLQLVATCVAIVAGVGAAWWHIEKAILAHRERIKGE